MGAALCQHQHQKEEEGRKKNIHCVKVVPEMPYPIDWFSLKGRWSALSQVDKVLLASSASIIVCLAFCGLHEKSLLAHTRGERLAALSNGAMDRNAREALLTLNNEGRSELTAEQLFTRAQLRDLNQHEGQRPTHTRAHEVNILNDYQATLYKAGTTQWMYDRIQDYLDRRYDQYNDLQIPAPVQYTDLQARLDDMKATHRRQLTSEPSQRIELNKMWKENDSQNVHDSGVHNSLQMLIERLQEKDDEVVLPLGLSDLKSDMLRYIAASDQSEYNKAKATAACHRICQSNASHHGLTQLNEGEVLELVWRRSYHPSNSVAQQSNIRDMVTSSLADMITQYDETQPNTLEQVCVTGRIGRLVDALTLTDAQSEDLGQPLSLDAMRNDIYEYAQKSLNEKIEQFKSMENDMGRVAQSYSDLSVEAAPESEQAFKESILSDVNDYMAVTYGTLLSGTHRADILETVNDSL